MVDCEKNDASRNAMLAPQHAQKETSEGLIDNSPWARGGTWRKAGLWLELVDGGT